jgi:WD40 repeat protein
MTLKPGTQLGPYEIVAPIGAGGMGEVYRAHDARVGRDVALKISAEQFNERFEREIRAVASLNHSNICTLYDVGPNYLVMELIEGPTLADRIKQGPIPLEESLEIARQIADALEAAHEKGIVHRDLKPANIKIKPDGTVKVLDFGLAKVGGTPVVSSENSPTLSVAQTAAGVILGTAAYMSPDQAKGKIVDKRADIWSFGVVLYEMLTGKQLFAGETVSDILASVIKEEPDWESIPAKVRPLLRRCLEKDAKRRLRDIGDAMPLLEGVPESGPAKRPWFAWSVAAELAVAIVAILALWAPWRAEEPTNRPLVRLDVDLGADVSLPSPMTQGPRVMISPDGMRLVYSSGNPPKLFIRGLDQPTATELPGTAGATACFFSPDGQWVGFPAGNKLNKISVEGGAVIPLGKVTARIFCGANWGEDGSILVGEAYKGMARIPSGGGPATEVTELANGESAHQFPQMLPGGKAILFVANSRPPGVDKATVEVLTLADHRRKILVRGASSARYLATSNGAGHLIYTNKATLFAVPFDPDKLEKRGTPVPILNDVAHAALTGSAEYDVSGSGLLVYRRGGIGSTASGLGTVQWVDPTGRRAPLRDKPGAYSNPRLSPDGKRLVFVMTEGGIQALWVYDILREGIMRLRSEDVFYRSVVWSPDGRHIIFGTSDGLFWTRADGASQPRELMQTKTPKIPWSVTSDGKRLAFSEISESSRQLWTVALEEQGGQSKAGKPEQFLKSQFDDRDPAFSRDGRWLAYTSNDSGRDEVWVRPFPPLAPGQGGQWQISNNGGTRPVWSPNGHELLYQSGDQIMSVEYRAKGDTFEVEKPKVWLAKLGGTQWDLAPDGKRIAVLTPVDTPEAPKQDHTVVFLLNFFDELRRRAPVGK